MTVEITEVRNVVTVSPVTQAVTVTETANTVVIGGPAHPSLPSHHPRDFAVTVGPAAEADYTTLQAAHDAGAPIIFVRDGSYAGFTWSDPAVKRIIGASPDGVKITGDCTFNVDGVTIASVWFYPEAADQKLKIDTLLYFGTPIKFENCWFGGETASPGALPIFLTKIVPGANASKPEFANCRFRGNPPCLWAKAWTFQASGSVWTDVTDGADVGTNGVLPDTAIFANNASGDILYLGVTSKLRLPFGFIVAPQGPTFGTQTPVYEFWNGTAWTATGFTVTGLHADAKNFKARGYVTLTPPSNWQLNSVGPAGNQVLGLWMRLRATAGGVSPVVKHLRPMGNQAFSDFDPDAMARRLWTAPKFDCSLEGYGLSNIVIDCTGAMANPAGAGVFRLKASGSIGTHLIAPAGSEVEIVTGRTDNPTRALLLGQNCKAKLFMYGGFSMDFGFVGEGGRVASATANTLVFNANADGLNGPQFFGGCKGCEVLILHGTGQGQRRVIIDDDANLTITVRDNWTVTPDTTSIAIIYDPLQYAVGIESGCEIDAYLSTMSVGVRAIGTANGNLFAVKGVFNGVINCVQPLADASALKRPYTVGPIVYTVGSDIHGGRGVVVDMGGQGTYTATPEANAAEGNLVGLSTGSKGAVVVTGRTATTKITAPSVPSDSVTGAGSSGSVFIPVADNEQSMGSATLALKEMWAYIQGVRNFVEFDEVADPAAPDVDRARLFVRDSPTVPTKTELCVRFRTGVVQVIAIQP